MALPSVIPRTLPMLLLLGVSGVYCDSHSMRYYITGVSSPGSGLPLYSVVGYVDDQEVTNYNSDTQRYLPKTEWMKNLGPEYWEEETIKDRHAEPIFKHNVKTAMNRFNHSEGLHTLQRMYGCELRDDGSIVGYQQYGYDGRDFMYLDTQRWIFIPTMNEAQISAQRWNSPDIRLAENDKYYLQNECITFLKKFVEYGREYLEKRVRPEMKAWKRPESDKTTRLHCLVYGFRPRAVDVKWMRNGVDHIPSDEMSPILPHPDGTYQIRVSVEVPKGEEESFSCYVEHSSLGEDPVRVNWDPDNGAPIALIVAIVCVVIALIAAIGVGIFFYLKNKRGYKTTSTSDTNSDSSNNPKA